MSSEDIKVYYASDKLLGIWSPATDYLLIIENAVEPDIAPSHGLLELSILYGEKVAEDDVLDKFYNYIKLGTRPEPLGRICQELDTVHNEEIERHLILDSDDKLIVETIDLLNEDGLYSVGSYTYNTEFNKIFYKE